MSTIDVLLLSQERDDALFADTSGLRAIIKTIIDAKRYADIVGTAEINDVDPSMYRSHIAGRYVPFASCMSYYNRQVLTVHQGADEKNIEFTIDAGSANYIGDIMIHVEFPRVTLADLTFNPAFPVWPTEGYGQIRYCQYPGVRFFDEVSLIYNGTVVETYTWENVLEYMQHELPEDKRIAYEKCVGQQQMMWGQSAYTFDSEGVPMLPGTQLWTAYTNGAQTPKNQQPPLSLCIPLMFTAFRDESIPLPNSMSTTKRTVRIKMSPILNIVSHYMDAPVGTLGSTFRLTSMTAYTRCIYMNPQLAGLFNTRKKTIVRSWKTVRTLSDFTGPVDRKLDEVKGMVEAMYVRFIPYENLTHATSLSAANIAVYDHYHVAAKVTKSQISQSLIGVASDSTMFQNALIIQTNSYEPMVRNVSLTVQETDFFGGPIAPTVAGPYMNFLESSIMRQPSMYGSYVFTFSQRYSGDRTRHVNGYIDMTKFSNKKVSWDSTLIGPGAACYVIISVRVLNAFEPREDGSTVYSYQI